MSLPFVTLLLHNLHGRDIRWGLQAQVPRIPSTVSFRMLFPVNYMIILSVCPKLRSARLKNVGGRASTSISASISISTSTSISASTSDPLEEARNTSRNIVKLGRNLGFSPLSTTLWRIWVFISNINWRPRANDETSVMCWTAFTASVVHELLERCIYAAISSSAKTLAEGHLKLDALEDKAPDPVIIMFASILWFHL